jgi:hypothetical protein
MAISLESGVPGLLQHENAQLARLISDVETIKDQMKKVAVILNSLSESVAAQRSKPEPQLSEIALMLQTMKTHVDSFPHALREARRSDIATQKAVENLAARVSATEAKVGTICSQSDASRTDG